MNLSPQQLAAWRRMQRRARGYYTKSTAASRRRAAYKSRQNPIRYTVPRTMGPFAVSESKYFDFHRSAVAVPDTTNWAGTEIDPTTLDTLVAPVEGSDINNRVGRKIAIYKIAIRGLIQAPTAAANWAIDQADVLPSPTYRIILYMDQQTNGVQSQGEEVMAPPSSATVALTHCTFMNIANLGRFKILKDKLIGSNTITAATDGASTSAQNKGDLMWKMTCKFRVPIIVNFNGTNGGTIGDIVDNSFHLIAHKSNSNYDANEVISYQGRAYYKDH